MKAPFNLPNYSGNFIALVISFLFLTTSTLFSQSRAFPTALGGAANARGDVNYTIHEVTNLNPDGPGSFWNALGNNRIVVFRVAGIINMGSVGGSRSLNNCIVLGQTAPEGGITVVGRGWRWDNCTNVVFRYVRFRTWQCQTDVWDPCSADSVDVLNSNNIIFDHCSFAYGGDETLSFRGASHTITVQNCMFSYGKTGMLLGDSNDYNLSYDMSLLNNFFTEISHRFPNPNSNGRVDIIGNMVYSWHNRIMRTGGAVQLNEIGNYYLHPEQENNGNSTWSWNKLDTTPNPPTIYTAMNRATTSLLDSDADDNSILWQSWQNGRDPIASDFTDTMFPLLNYTDPLPNGDDTLLKVQNRAMGANAYLDNNGNAVVGIDDLDLEAYDGFDNRTYYDWSTSLDWEDLPQRQWLIDNLQNYGVVQNAHDQSTHTGVVPNVWITSQGLNPSTFNPLGNDLDTTYTNIEIYSFGVDGAAAEAIVAQSVTVSPESVTLNIPETITLTLTFNPINTTNKSGTWSSSDETIATVNNEGTVTPIAPGEATITFEANDGGFTSSSIITVTNIIIDLESIEVNPENMLLDIGQTDEATVQFTPNDATFQDGTWSSDDASVATVDDNGQVTGIDEGETIIRFTTEDEEFSDIINVTVDDIFFGTYEFYNAATDEFIQNITEDTSFDINDIGNEINFRSIPQGGDDNTAVESINVQWTGPENGSWTESIPIYAGMNNHTDLSFEPYVVSEGTYNFTVTFYDEDDGNGNIVAVDTFSLTFFFGNGVNANAGDDITICEGESTTITATGGSNFLWDNGETTASITVSPTETTTYTVFVSNDEGVEESDDVVVTVNPVPIATVTSNQTICNGESVSLTAQGGTTYLWSTGETTATISVSPNSDTEYSVEVITNGCSSSASTTISVNPAPNLTISDDITIMLGNTINLNSSGAESYLWSTGDTTASIEVSPTETTQYTVSGFIGDCEDSAIVTVTVLPELDANAGQDVSICEGESVTLTGAGGINYEWSTGANTNSIEVAPAVTTTFTLTVSDNQGNSDTDSVTVTVNDIPNVSAGQNSTIVEGDYTSLMAQGADSYLWNTGETTPTINVNPTQTTTYSVIGTTNSCESEAQVTITVEALFTASAGEDIRVCENDNSNVQLTAGSGDTYLWNTGETTQTITVSPLSTSTYTVTVTQGIQEDSDSVTVFVDPNPNVVISNGESIDILSGDFVTLSASGANSYEWNNGATQPNIAVSPSETTTFEVRGFVGDCYDEKQVVINVYQPVFAYAGENETICEGDTIVLEATGGDDYLWSTGDTTQTIEVSPLVTTDYTVTVFNALDFDEATVTVEVDANCDLAPPIDSGEESQEITLDVFPNPARDIVNVRIAGRRLVTNISVIDISGKLILQSQINNNNLQPTVTQELNISALKSGLYFVKLMDGDNDIVKKLMIN